MAMEEKIQMGSHKLTLQNRRGLMLTGVKDVVVFDENPPAGRCIKRFHFSTPFLKMKY